MKKRNIYLITILVSLIIVITLAALYLNKNKYSLNVADNNYLSKIKDKVIDIAYISDYPVYSDEKGPVDNFLNYLEKATNLSFNKISYTKEKAASTKYSIGINNKGLKSNDLLINEDPYVIISKENESVDTALDLKGYIGVLESDFEDLSYYMSTDKDISFKAFKTVDELINNLNSNQIKYIALPNLMYLDKYEGKGYYRVIALTDKINNIVFTLSPNKKDANLNKIFTKVFNSWKEENFIDLYNKTLVENYSKLHGILDKDKANFLSKIYTYGYVENSPYELKYKDKIKGIAGEYVERLRRLTGADIQYKRFNSVKELQEAINKNNIDIFFNYYDLKADGYKSTKSPFNEKYLLLRPSNGQKVIVDITSIKDQEVNTLDNTTLKVYLETASKAKIKPVKRIKDLKKNHNLIAIDKETYKIYRNKYFKDYIIAYEDTNKLDYNFMLNNNHALLLNIFEFSMNSNAYQKYQDRAYKDLNNFHMEKKNYEDIIMILAMIILFPIISLIIVYMILNKKSMIKKIDKEDRARYTDELTKLKNRNYLNHNITYWNKSGVYPQSVILLDLNNINYINDNYGHEEGDRVIKETASILISTQLENSEIMRTDGNEFMVYMIGYTEKQTEIYVKKLKKELKQLPYKFGAGIAYSMILDEIKTVNDAMNEALLGVKIDKEEK